MRERGPFINHASTQPPKGNPAAQHRQHTQPGQMLLLLLLFRDAHGAADDNNRRERLLFLLHQMTIGPNFFYKMWIIY